MSRFAAVWLFLVVACGPADHSIAAKGSACSAAKPCVAGLVCQAGTCQEEPPSPVCTAGAERCNGGNEVLRCKSDGSGWESKELCADRCRADRASASCVVCTCDPNSADATQRLRCEGDEVMVCRADCSGFDPVEKCSNGCDPATAACR